MLAEFDIIICGADCAGDYCTCSGKSAVLEMGIGCG